MNESRTMGTLNPILTHTLLSLCFQHNIASTSYVFLSWMFYLQFLCCQECKFFHYTSRIEKFLPTGQIILYLKFSFVFLDGIQSVIFKLIQKRFLMKGLAVKAGLYLKTDGGRVYSGFHPPANSFSVDELRFNQKVELLSPVVPKSLGGWFFCPITTSYLKEQQKEIIILYYFLF